MRRKNRQILKLALPAILNNITVPLLGLCDTAISGHLGEAKFIGAIAVGAMMINVIFWLCGFLRAGTAGLAAQAVGAGDYIMARDVLTKSLCIAGLIGACAICLQRPLSSLLLYTMEPGPDVADLAALYFKILIWSAPAQLGMMAATGWFIGMQNTVVPMVVAIGVNVVNISLSLLMVFVFQFGFKGIAFGTLCANWLGLAAAFAFILRELSKHTYSYGTRRVRWMRFFKVNRDLFLRSACIMLVTLTVTSLGARMGEETLAVNAVMMQFFLFFSYFMDGFAFAGEALAGKAAGAHDLNALHITVKALLRWGAAMAIFFFFAYFAFSGPLTGLITDLPGVRHGVAAMRPWLISLPPITVAAFIFDGIFIGLTRTGWLFLTTLAAAIIFFCIAWFPFISNQTVTNSGLWLGFETYLLVRGLSLYLVYRLFLRKGDRIFSGFS